VGASVVGALWLIASAAAVHEPFRHRRKYVPVGCVRAIAAMDGGVQQWHRRILLPLAHTLPKGLMQFGVI
jgi:hypothetical protein